MSDAPHTGPFVSTYECDDCGLRVRLETRFKVSRCTRDCRRCDEETTHTLTDEPVPESEATSYV